MPEKKRGTPENLLKMRELPPEERSRRASIAGSAPHPGRKRKKDLREIANIINSADIKSEKTKNELRKLGQCRAIEA